MELYNNNYSYEKLFDQVYSFVAEELNLKNGTGKDFFDTFRKQVKGLNSELDNKISEIMDMIEKISHLNYSLRNNKSEENPDFMILLEMYDELINEMKHLVKEEKNK